MPISRERRALFLVTLVACAVAVASARPYAGSWNDGSRLATVECLVDEGTLVIDDSIFVAVPPADNPHAPQPYRSVAVETGTHDKLFIKGHYYSDKSPVPAVLLAAIYKLLQLLGGLQARLHTSAFCWCMTVASSGVAYVAAAVCVFRLGQVAGLALGWRLLLTGSFGLATVAVVYVQQVNNHIMLLGVAAALMLQAAQLPGPASWCRLLFLGCLAGLAYAIDLGAGPPLLAATGLFVAWQCGRRLGGCVWFALGALPWLGLHHALNYAVGGTFGPANAVAEYFQWPGCPFAGATLTGAWHHKDVASFGVYSFAMLFGKRGFVGHNLPLFLLLPALWWLLRCRGREWPVLLLAAVWAATTWLLYAASSRNYSGANCSVRWLVPLLAPAYYALAVVMARCPAYRAGFVVLSAWGTVLMGVAWLNGPWTAHLVPWYWPIQGAALTSWAIVTWQRMKRAAKMPGYAGNPPHFALLHGANRTQGQEILRGDLQ